MIEIRDMDAIKECIEHMTVQQLYVTRELIKRAGKKLCEHCNYEMGDRNCLGRAKGVCKITLPDEVMKEYDKYWGEQ